MSGSTERHDRSWFSPGVVVLLLSVALNGLLGGVLLADMGDKTSAAQHTVPITEAIALTGEPQRIIRQLPPQRRRVVLRQALKNVAQTDRRQYRRMTAAYNKAKRHVFELSSAPTLDTKALAQAMIDMQSAHDRLATASNELMVQVLAEMTDAERLMVMEKIKEKQLQRRRRAQEGARANRRQQQQTDRRTPQQNQDRKNRRERNRD
jgi:uncharacterized membrane protein